MNKYTIRNIVIKTSITTTTAFVFNILLKYLKAHYPQLINLTSNYIYFTIVIVSIIIGMVIGKMKFLKINKGDTIDNPKSTYFVTYKGISFLAYDSGSFVDVDTLPFCPKCKTPLIEKFSILFDNYYCPTCNKTIRTWHSLPYLHFCAHAIERGKYFSKYKSIDINPKG